MVAGPFDEHPLMAIQQKTKVCPILNLSAPENFSFNDTVDENRIRKLEMSSASLFIEIKDKTQTHHIPHLWNVKH